MTHAGRKTAEGRIIVTQNQLAYQQNLIRAREAAVKEEDQKIKTSEHLFDYGHIRRPLKGAEVEYGGLDWGMKPTKNASEVWANVAKALNPLISVMR